MPPTPTDLPRLALPVTELARDRDIPFSFAPDGAGLAAMGAELGLTALRKLRFEGTVGPEGAEDFRLTGHLGATVVQPCVVTLAPVTTRIETAVHRLYLRRMPEPEGDEVEMPGDDTAEALPARIDLVALAMEVLALNLPLYPRAEGAELGEAVFSAPGVTPMRDEDARPFAGLGALKDKLGRGDDDGE